MQRSLLALVVLGSCVACVCGGDENETAVSGRTQHYYDVMWYRHWTFPVTMAILAKVMSWVMFISYFSTIVQAIAYQRSEPQLPEIYSVPAHWEHSSFNGWG